MAKQKSIFLFEKKMQLLQTSVQDLLVPCMTFHMRNTLLSPVGTYVFFSAWQVSWLKRLQFHTPSHSDVKQWIHMKSQLYSGGTALDFHQLPF